MKREKEVREKTFSELLQTTSDFWSKFPNKCSRKNSVLLTESGFPFKKNKLDDCAYSKVEGHFIYCHWQSFATAKRSSVWLQDILWHEDKNYIYSTHTHK
jgi:hypothetical protein